VTGRAKVRRCRGLRAGSRSLSEPLTRDGGSWHVPPGSHVAAGCSIRSGRDMRCVGSPVSSVRVILRRPAKCMPRITEAAIMGGRSVLG
jgi:hypothetical protein